MILSENRLPLFRIMLWGFIVRAQLIVEHIGARAYSGRSRPQRGKHVVGAFAHQHMTGAFNHW